MLSSAARSLPGIEGPPAELIWEPGSDTASTNDEPIKRSEPFNYSQATQGVRSHKLYRVISLLWVFAWDLTIITTPS